MQFAVIRVRMKRFHQENKHATVLVWFVATAHHDELHCDN
jgi:hypothetical protein